MFGTGLNPYGYAINYKFCRSNEMEKKLIHGDFYIEAGNIINPREIAQVNQTVPNSGIYKFGKINYAWAFRPYYMFRKPLSTRQDRKNVALNAVFGAGTPVAWYWPVYINYYNPDVGQGGSTTKVKYDPAIHKQEQVAGRAGFGRGFGEGAAIPGLGINTAVEFIWGNYRTDVKVVTLGVRLENYSRAVPLIYRSDLIRKLYSMFYLNFALGFGKS